MSRRLALTWLAIWLLVATAVAAGVLVGSLLANVAVAASRSALASPSSAGELTSPSLPGRTEAPNDPVRVPAPATGDARPGGASPSPSASPRSVPASEAAATAAPMGGTIAEARAYALRRLGPTQFRCLDSLVQRESRWRVDATNRRSGAYGLFQTYPAARLDSFGDRHDPMVQMRWGLAYIHGRYETPCNALRHALDHGWY